jgi:nicotinamidase-related amidase
MLELNPATTAVVLIDLQKGILGMPLAPHSAADVFARGTELADRFRAAGATIVRVKVEFGGDFADAPSNNVDKPGPRARGSLPADFAAFPDDPAAQGDLIVTKRHWGAFHGTDLDLRLRRRGIRTIVLAGIATNIGVESTARSAHEYGYDLVIAEDATTGTSAEMHAFSMDNILPRIARVRKTAEIIVTGT